MKGQGGNTPIADLIDAGVLLINDGYRAKNSELGVSGVPFARAQNINNGFKFDDIDRFPLDNLHRIGSKISRAGDVVFTSKGTVGRFALVRSDTPQFVYSPQLCYWRSLKHDVIDSRWLFYWMQSREFFAQYSGVAGQTDMADYVSLRDQRAMHITFPPLPEQNAIASILGALDDKIELNRRMNETLEGMARAIFKSWFVDFDPVRAQQRGQQPVGMDAATAALFPREFTDSPLGKIPKGWKVTSLGDECEVVRGLSYKGDFLTTRGVGLPMHNLNSVYEGGGYKHEGLKWYCGEYRDVHVLQPGDVIVTNTEQGFEYLLIGYAAIVPSKYGRGGLFSHHLYRLRPVSKSYLPPWFFYELLRTRRFHEVIAGYTNGTTVNMLPTDGMQKPQFVLPPIPVVSRVSQLFDRVVRRSELCHDENESLATLRDTLLPRLMSGELRVKAAEKFVEEV